MDKEICGSVNYELIVLKLREIRDKLDDIQQGMIKNPNALVIARITKMRTLLVELESELLFVEYYTTRER